MQKQWNLTLDYSYLPKKERDFKFLNGCSGLPQRIVFWPLPSLFSNKQIIETQGQVFYELIVNKMQESKQLPIENTDTKSSYLRRQLNYCNRKTTAFRVYLSQKKGNFTFQGHSMWDHYCFSGNRYNKDQANKIHLFAIDHDEHLMRLNIF